MTKSQKVIKVDPVHNYIITTLIKLIINAFENIYITSIFLSWFSVLLYINFYQMEPAPNAFLKNFIRNN